MSMPATMRALQQTSLNGPQDLRLITDAPVPTPGPDEVLIRVTAAGVNFLDISMARGVLPGGPQPPYLAGFEAAGEIVAVGERVAGLAPGVHVIGVNMRGGAFAEYLALPAAAAVPVPPGWADEQALGLVVNWPTALAAWSSSIAVGRAVRPRTRVPRAIAPLVTIATSSPPARAAATAAQIRASSSARNSPSSVATIAEPSLITVRAIAGGG